MNTATSKSGAGWEWLTESPTQSEEASPENSTQPRSRIRRRYEAMLVNMLGDKADRPTAPDQLEVGVPEGNRSKHGLRGPRDTHKRSGRPSAPRHASN